MIKKIFSALLCIASFGIVACAKQPKYISYDEPYDLEKLDFGLDVATFYSKVDNDKISVYSEEITKRDWLDTTEAPTGFVAYKQMAWLNRKTLAIYGPLRFTRMSIIDGPKKQLYAAGASKDNIDPNALREALEYCTNKLGNAQKKTYNDFGNHQEVYSWEDSTRLVKLVTYRKKKGEGELRVGITKNPKNEATGIEMPEPEEGFQTDVHFFIVNKKIKDPITIGMNGGEFSYYRE